MNFHMIVGVSALIACMGSAGPVSAATAVERHGWLRTEGPYLLNEKGNIVQLKGLSFYWSNPSWNGWSYYNESTVDALVDQWKCTVLRAAYDRDGGNNNGWDGVQRVINQAIKKGIYVIIDWHSHTAHEQEGAAVQFFKEQAQAYKNTPNVIFEPYNEPKNAGGSSGGTQTAAVTTWGAIKPYLQNVTQAIRDAGSKNLVVVGTPYYCQFVDIAASSPLRDKSGKPFTNLAYSFHFYAASHGPEAYYVKQGQISEGSGGMESEYLMGGLSRVPIFVTEWGTTHSNGGQDGMNYIDGTNTDWWFERFINGPYHLSWCNWSASSFEASSAFSGGTNPSASGQIAKKYLNDTEDEFEPPSKAGNPGPFGETVTSMPATKPAAKYNRYYGAYVSAAPIPYTSRDRIDPRTAADSCLKVLGGANGDWVSYYLKSSAGSKLLIVRCLAKQGSGSMEVFLGNKNVGTIDIEKGNDWVCKELTIDAAAGTDTLKFVITNALENGFFVEWFEMGDKNTCLTTVVASRGQRTQRQAEVTRFGSTLAVSLPPRHGYSLFRLMSADGRAVRRGVIVGDRTNLTIADLPCGMWLLELGGRAGRKMFRVMVSGN